MSARSLQRVFGPRVKLALAPEAAEGEPKPVWIQAALEGHWEGHPSGVEVDFTRAVFDQIITNFRDAPEYTKGADGYGSEPVVPMDYEHASELHPASGSIPLTGAGAPGWLLDLEVRDGADGKAQLWALAQLGETLRGQIKRGEYRWTSVAVWTKALDAASGAVIGAKLTSLAVTNKPFIRGMEPMVAASLSAYGKAETAEEALVGLRSIFELDATADAAAAMAEVAKLFSLVASGVKMPGLDLEWLVSSIRGLFGLPKLTLADEISAAVSAALAPLLQGNSTEGTSSASPVPGDRQEQKDMSANTLSAKLAAVLKCRDTDDAIMLAAQDAATSANDLQALMDLIGAGTTQELLANATKLIELSKKVEPLVAALQEANKGLAANDQKAAEEEVEAVAATMGLGEEQLKRVKPMLLRERLACFDEERTEFPMPGAKQALVLTSRKLNETKLAEFRKNFPLPQGDKTKQYLTQQIASQGSVQLGGQHTGLGAPGAGGPSTPAPDHIVKLRGYPGANDVLKAIACLDATVEGFKLRSWHEKCRVAGEYVRSGQLPAH